MKYLLQLFCILVFTLIGELLQAIIPLPIPAAIYGILLMLLALSTGILKPEHISETAHFLISIMPVMYVAPAVNILEQWGLISPALVPICIISVSTTVLVFAVAGLATQCLLHGKEEPHA